MDNIILQAFQTKMIMGNVYKKQIIPKFIRNDPDGVKVLLNVNDISIVGRCIVSFLYEKKKFWVVIPVIRKKFLVNIPIKYIKSIPYV